jgi:hypothetical protein
VFSLSSVWTPTRPGVRLAVRKRLTNGRLTKRLPTLRQIRTLSTSRSGTSGRLIPPTFLRHRTRYHQVVGLPVLTFRMLLRLRPVPSQPSGSTTLRRRSSAVLRAGGRKRALRSRLLRHCRVNTPAKCGMRPCCTGIATWATTRPTLTAARMPSQRCCRSASPSLLPSSGRRTTTPTRRAMSRHFAGRLL